MTAAWPSLLAVAASLGLSVPAGAPGDLARKPPALVLPDPRAHAAARAETSSARTTAPAVPKVVLRLSLAEVSRDQARAWLRYEAGSAILEAAAGLDPEASLWLKFRQRATVALPFDKLGDPFFLELGEGPLEGRPEGGIVRVYPAVPPQSPQALVSVPALLRSLYELSLHVLLPAVEYGVLYEDGATVPASLCLLRRDASGRLYATYRTLAQMRDYQWFVAVDGVLYGMRIEGTDLVFYSKPVPPVR